MKKLKLSLVCFVLLAVMSPVVACSKETKWIRVMQIQNTYDNKIYSANIIFTNEKEITRDEYTELNLNNNITSGLSTNNKLSQDELEKRLFDNYKDNQEIVKAFYAYFLTISSVYIYGAVSGITYLELQDSDNNWNYRTHTIYDNSSQRQEEYSSTTSIPKNLLIITHF